MQTKKVFFILIFIVLTFCMVACIGNKNSSHESQKLSAAEISWFEDEFFNQGIPYSMANMFLTCEYSDIKDIDLSSVFYNGTEASSNITDEERDFFLRESGADPSYGIFKSTVSQMNKTLESYVGRSLSEFDNTKLSSFTYLKEFDSYFISHTDTNYFICDITDGERLGSDEYVLTYHDKNGDTSNNYIVTLKVIDKNNGIYHFISNKKAEEN